MDVRKTNKESIIELLGANAPLDKDATGKYSNTAVEEMTKEVRTVLQSIYCELKSDDKEGVEELLDALPNKINGVKTTSGVSAQALVDEDKQRRETEVAERAANKTNDPINPVMTMTAAIDIANRKNTIYNTIIGIKDGTLHHYKIQCGASIMNPVINKPNSTRPKPLDEVLLSNVIIAANAGARRSSFATTLQDSTDLLSFKFNWQQTIEDNVNHLITLATVLETKNLEVTPSFVVLITMANVEQAVKFPWGEALKDSYKKLSTKYASTKHDEDTRLEVMKEFKEAEKFRDLTAAPTEISITPEEANAVFNNWGYESLIDDYSDTETEEDYSEEESAYATSSYDSDAEYTRRAMKEKKKRQEKSDRKAAEKKEKSKKKTKQSSRRRGTPKKESTPKKEKKESTKEEGRALGPRLNYGCKHCVKWRKSFVHPEPPNKCIWNPSADVYRSERICKLMGIEFKNKTHFSYENGGMAPLAHYKGDSSSESENE